MSPEGTAEAIKSPQKTGLDKSASFKKSDYGRRKLRQEGQWSSDGGDG